MRQSPPTKKNKEVETTDYVFFKDALFPKQISQQINSFSEVNTFSLSSGFYHINSLFSGDV